MPHRVVNFREVKELLQCWDQVRQRILNGTVKGFALTIQDGNGEDSTFLGGLYESDPTAGLKASLRQSWEMTKSSGSSG